mmetsp:Transcript_2750/g.3733  ORF Transcript_2750/g.3733 Transcript_2750/m.3733 type:complete len:361 (-) Transcript_2750:1408-2490(-)
MEDTLDHWFPRSLQQKVAAFLKEMSRSPPAVAKHNGMLFYLYETAAASPRQSPRFAPAVHKFRTKSPCKLRAEYDHLPCAKGEPFFAMAGVEGVRVDGDCYDKLTANMTEFACRILSGPRPGPRRANKGTGEEFRARLTINPLSHLVTFQTFLREKTEEGSWLPCCCTFSMKNSWMTELGSEDSSTTCNLVAITDWAKESGLSDTDMYRFRARRQPSPASDNSESDAKDGSSSGSEEDEFYSSSSHFASQTQQGLSHEFLEEDGLEEFRVFVMHSNALFKRQGKDCRVLLWKMAPRLSDSDRSENRRSRARSSAALSKSSVWSGGAMWLHYIVNSTFHVFFRLEKYVCTSHAPFKKKRSG